MKIFSERTSVDEFLIHFFCWAESLQHNSANLLDILKTHYLNIMTGGGQSKFKFNPNNRLYKPVLENLEWLSREYIGVPLKSEIISVIW